MTHLIVKSKSGSEHEGTLQTDSLHDSNVNQAPIAIAQEVAELLKQSAGASWEHVVHVNSYHVGGFPPEVNDAMVKLYRHYMPVRVAFPMGNRTPIWTQVGVAALGLPTMRIEIRVTAITS